MHSVKGQLFRAALSLLAAVLMLAANQPRARAQNNAAPTMTPVSLTKPGSEHSSENKRNGVGVTIDLINKATTTAGILVGGGWIYFLFIRGRTLKPRIVPNVTALILSRNNKHYVHITVSVENRGSTELHVDNENSSIIVQAGVRARFQFSWIEFYAFDALTKENLVEPGVKTEEQHVVQLPSAPKVPLRIEFILRRKTRSRYTPQWTASCVLIPNASEEGQRSVNI